MNYSSCCWLFVYTGDSCRDVLPWAAKVTPCVQFWGKSYLGMSETLIKGLDMTSAGTVKF